MRVSAIFILFFCLSIFISAHDSDKAFFTITEKVGYFEIEAEFPWSLRNALIKAYPYLDEAKTKNEFDRSFFDYIQKNFRLYDVDNNLLTLKCIEFLPESKERHSHGGNYLMTFDGKNLRKVINTVMFNLYRKQKNYHNIILGKEKYNFVSTLNQPEFELKI